MVTKLGIQYGKDTKEEHLLLRREELEIFLSGVCSHKIIGQVEEVKIFLNENQ